MSPPELPLTCYRPFHKSGKGVEFITDRGGQPIYVDLFGKTERAIITATSGGGKSVLGFRFIVDALAQGIPVVGMDISTGGDSTFSTACRMLGDKAAFFNMANQSYNLVEPPDLRGMDKKTVVERLNRWKQFLQQALVGIAMGSIHDPKLQERVNALVVKMIQVFTSNPQIIDRYNMAFEQGFHSNAWQNIPTLHDLLKFCSKEKLGLKSFEEIDRLAINQIVNQISAKLDDPEIGQAIGRPSTIPPDPMVKIFALSGLNNDSNAQIMALLLLNRTFFEELTMKTAQILFTALMGVNIAIANSSPTFANPNPNPSTNVFINNPLNPTQPNHLTQPTNNRSENNNAGNSSGGESFDFEGVLGEFNPEQLVSQAQQKLESQINQLLGSFSELLAINPGDYFEKILDDLNLENLDLSNIYGEMNVPNPNKLLEELQNIGTGDFSFGELLGSSVSDNLLLINEAHVELTGKLAKSQAESSAFSDEAQEKIKEKIEFGDETTQTSAELAAATQKAAEQGKTLVQTGQGTDVTQELERLQLEAMGLQLDAEASQSSQLSILAAQQAAIYTETQQSRIDNAMRNQILSDISTALQGDKAGERVQHSANIRALSEGSQFSTFREMKE